MRKKAAIPSVVEIMFVPTPDGLVLDRVVLHPANGNAERDLQRFLQRFRDPDVDLEAKTISGGDDGKDKDGTDEEGPQRL